MSAISCTGAKTKCVYYRKYGPNLKLLNTGQLRGDLFMNEDLHHLQKKLSSEIREIIYINIIIFK